MPTGLPVTTSTHHSGQHPSDHVTVVGTRVDAAYSEQEKRKRARHEERVRRMFWYVVIFCITFIFTAGFLALGILLWVRPEALLTLVIIGILTSGVFVATFATLRSIILQRLYPGPFLHEEEGSSSHHVGIGVAYGMVALVIAILLASILINIATAFTI